MNAQMCRKQKGIYNKNTNLCIKGGTTESQLATNTVLDFFSRFKKEGGQLRHIYLKTDTGYDVHSITAEFLKPVEMEFSHHVSNDESRIVLTDWEHAKGARSKNFVINEKSLDSIMISAQESETHKTFYNHESERNLTSTGKLYGKFSKVQFHIHERFEIPLEKRKRMYSIEPQ